MVWSAFKLGVLDMLMKWLAGELWTIAQAAVTVLTQREDLTGPEKLALVRAQLQDRAKTLDRSFATGMLNFLIEAAVQYVKAASERDE